MWLIEQLALDFEELAASATEDELAPSLAIKLRFWIGRRNMGLVRTLLAMEVAPSPPRMHQPPKIR